MPKIHDQFIVSAVKSLNRADGYFQLRDLPSARSDGRHALTLLRYLKDDDLTPETMRKQVEKLEPEVIELIHLIESDEEWKARYAKRFEEIERQAAEEMKELKRGLVALVQDADHNLQSG